MLHFYVSLGYLQSFIKFEGKKRLKRSPNSVIKLTKNFTKFVIDFKMGQIFILRFDETLKRIGVQVSFFHKNKWLKQAREKNSNFMKRIGEKKKEGELNAPTLPVSSHLKKIVSRARIEDRLIQKALKKLGINDQKTSKIRIKEERRTSS